MASVEFHSVLEMDLRRDIEWEVVACLDKRRSTQKAEWEGEQLEDLAGRRPEELPRYFIAVDVQGENLSLSKGWTTKHGRWEPKESFRCMPGLALFTARTTLVFRPNDGSKSDLVMTMFNTINWTTKYFLEEDMTFCCVSRDPKGKGKGYAADQVNEFPKHDYAFNLDLTDFLESDLSWSDLYNSGLAAFQRVQEDFELPFGGAKKRPRPNTKPAGGSNAWGSFTKIYTKDPKVVYAACHYCGRMFKLKGGSTSSLLKHSKTCPCKPDACMDTLV